MIQLTISGTMLKSGAIIKTKPKVTTKPKVKTEPKVKTPKIKPTPKSTSDQEWEQGYGIKGYPTPQYGPKGMTKLCAQFWTKKTRCYDKDHCTILHPDRYGRNIYAAYKARGLPAAWAAAVIIFKRSCMKATGEKAFAGQQIANVVPDSHVLVIKNENAERFYASVVDQSEDDILPTMLEIQDEVHSGRLDKFIPTELKEFIYS